MSCGYMNQMEFLLIVDHSMFFFIQMTGQTPYPGHGPAALGYLAVTMDARDVSVTGQEVFMAERLIDKGNRLIREGMTCQAVPGGNRFLTPVVEVAGQARGLADTNVLALDGLAMTAHTVQ